MLIIYGVILLYKCFHSTRIYDTHVCRCVEKCLLACFTLLYHRLDIFFSQRRQIIHESRLYVLSRKSKLSIQRSVARLPFIKCVTAIHIVVGSVRRLRHTRKKSSCAVSFCFQFLPELKKIHMFDYFTYPLPLRFVSMRFPFALFMKRWRKIFD